MEGNGEELERSRRDGAGWEVSYKGENGSGRDSDKEGCYRIREGN